MLVLSVLNFEKEQKQRKKLQANILGIKKIKYYNVIGFFAVQSIFKFSKCKILINTF